MPPDRIPILILVDCEPDPRLVRRDRLAKWLGFERLYEVLSDRREALGAHTCAPAHFSWFWRMDLQVEVAYGGADWALRTYAHHLDECERIGDEIGVHAHAWRWDDGHNEWVADHGSPEVVEKCVRHSCAAFEQALRRTCEIFRFGDGWIDEATLQLLEELGVRIDLTIEPGHGGVPSLVATERTTGSIPDRRGTPRWPYRPSRLDFRKPDENRETGIWCLPVTTGAYRTWPERGRRMSLDAWREAWPLKRTTLHLGMRSDLFQTIFDRAVSSGRRPYAAMPVRTDAGAHAGMLACVRRNLDAMLNHRLANRFAFVTPTEGLRMLTG